MSEIKDGGNEPAFPVSDLSKHQFCGLSMRDWFAGQALSGVMYMISAGQHDLGGNGRPGGAKGVAFTAYEIADAMLIHRSKA